MLTKKVENYINKYRLLEQGDRAVVGLSGGADSVCLLLLLYELSKKMGFSVCAVHVNHMIRGEEAAEDEAFVRNLCARLGVELIVSKVDVPAYASMNKLSEEEAGRIIRYREFRKVSPKVAVAHNKDDQVETIMLNIIRGTSLSGLSGMKPERDGIIRPLLDVSRAEIEQYLKERGEDYRIDSTNLESEYTRNKLRNKIIPLIKEINPAFGDRLIDLARSAQGADEITTQAARYVLDECPAIKDKAIYLSLSELAGTRKDITAKHVESVAALDEKKVGAKAHLPYGIIAEKEYDGISLRKMDAVKAGIVGATKEDREKKLKRLKKALKKAEIIDYHGEEIPNLEYKKYLDYDKIKGKLSWRYRAKGDIISLDNLCHKKLKDYMIDVKIPKEQRDDIPLLTDGKEVVWVLGGRLSSDYKVSKGTKRILVINVGEE